MKSYFTFSGHATTWCRVRPQTYVLSLHNEARYIYVYTVLLTGLREYITAHPLAEEDERSLDNFGGEGDKTVKSAMLGPYFANFCKWFSDQSGEGIQPLVISHLE